MFYEIFVKTMDYLGRRRVIYDRLNNEPYLERYYIFLKERRYFPFNIFLHRFLKSDPDEFHDHPWNFRTIILRGGYWEHTHEGKFWRKPWDYRYCSANTFHRIELDSNVKECWTLFIPSKSYKEWGFETKDGWLNHLNYFNLKQTK